MSPELGEGLPEDFLELRNSPVLLPERSLQRIHPRIFELVDSARRNLPRDLRVLIPPLREEDVLVCTNESLLRFIRQQAYQEQHSKRLEFLSELNGRFNVPIQDPTIMTVTEHPLPGKPVFFPESEIEVWTGQQTASLPAEVRQANMDIVTGKVLLHENIHRVTKTIVRAENAVLVAIDDPLFNMSFTSDITLAKNAKEAGVKEFALEFTDNLRKYAMEKNPAVLVEGARILLFCDDTDGKRRIIAQSGYNLNEVTVDILTMHYINPMFEGIRRRYPSEIAEDAIYRVRSSRVMGSAQQIHLLPNPFEYYRSLGLSRPDQVFQAYVSEQIPELHARLLPGGEYFV